ncbi:Myo-inositol 2-dehydrogenase [Lachnellula willkommii]|uniref:Myo-inositol 2-dehydrogenase n=1 Tax=Lachnellula willkommii TaxID=215461 RepID=A0A559MDD5_9HELO|nr:Myo-inositol 2-dehydrogenase [Lachnellula willkommii]
MASSRPTPKKILGVGIVGCGEVSQTIHIPTLGHMSDYFQVTYLCDVSSDALQHCKTKVAGKTPETTRDIKELCASPNVDIVLIANSNEYHAAHTIIALEHDKHVMLEKPASINVRDGDAIIAAEQKSKGKVFVGYMRRYAAAFVDAIKEIGGIDKILYARVRDIIGPNSIFVDQSGCFPKKFSDFKPEDTQDMTTRGTELMTQALEEECGVVQTDQSKRFWRILGGLGTHDLSAMREVLGMPTSVKGVAYNFPFWNVLFQYEGFAVSYESGMDQVPRFDAHIELYTAKKTIRVQYDTPYVKGLPVTLHISENVDGTYKESMIRKTYEDAYTLELFELYAMATEGKAHKTTAVDAKKDLEIFGMIMKAGFPKMEK